MSSRCRVFWCGKSTTADHSQQLSVAGLETNDWRAEPSGSSGFTTATTTTGSLWRYEDWAELQRCCQSSCKRLLTPTTPMRTLYRARYILYSNSAILFIGNLDHFFLFWAKNGDCKDKRGNESFVLLYRLMLPEKVNFSLIKWFL